MAPEDIAELEVFAGGSIGYVTVEAFETGRAGASLHPARQCPPSEAMAAEVTRNGPRGHFPVLYDARDALCCKRLGAEAHRWSIRLGCRLPVRQHQESPEGRTIGDTSTCESSPNGDDRARLASPSGSGTVTACDCSPLVSGRVRRVPRPVDSICSSRLAAGSECGSVPANATRLSARSRHPCRSSGSGKIKRLMIDEVAAIFFPLTWPLWAALRSIPAMVSEAQTLLVETVCPAARCSYRIAVPRNFRVSGCEAAIAFV